MRLRFESTMIRGPFAILGRGLVCLLIAISGVVASNTSAVADEPPGAAAFHKDIQPILAEYCYDCHGDGMNKGNVAFDEFKSDAALLESRELWWKALKNLRAGVMPPDKKPKPSDEEKQRITQWIKSRVFEIDPENPDPGQVTVRRLNRVEYRNTVRDLIGVDYNTDVEFPPDDTGHGFDNNADVLTLPPMLLEKYLDAARTVVSEAVPVASRVIAEKTIRSRALAQGDSDLPGEGAGGPLVFSYYEPAAILNTFHVEQEGRYQLVLKLSANEKYVDNQFDYNKCRFIFSVDGKELMQQEFTRQDGKSFHYEFDQEWKTGEHKLAFEVQPLTPDEKQIRSLALRIDSVTMRGPYDEKYWVKPKNYDRFFPKDIPKSKNDRLKYARELMGDFARRAFRRPVDEQTVNRLASLAEEVYGKSGKTFESGIAHAMVAVLASPRFLFREETLEPKRPDQPYPSVDEYTLASRLSYFLWSSMPDEELFSLASKGKLRENLPAQVKRMLADSRSAALMRNFTGQWLQARDIETVVIDSRAVLARDDKPDPEMEHIRDRFRELRAKNDEDLTPDEKVEMEKIRGEFRKRFGPLRANLDGDLRKAMQQETEKFFEYIVRQDRPLVELLDSDYTFLNARLAAHYGLGGVSGNEVRFVKLPPDSPRGGILGQGTVLAVTSNPTRTSPVKRGLFVLDNILGMPPPPPPPNIPPLEDAAKGAKDHEPTLRETLALHRANPLCSSCHNRMDPLGLAMENFNAMGMWREEERNQPIDTAGKLITGEPFKDIRDLKTILAKNHREDFYHCLTEKLLTYALGRGLEYYDVETVDEIVSRIDKEDGHFSALLMGVIESAPFQKSRGSVTLAQVQPSKPVQLRAERD